MRLAAEAAKALAWDQVIGYLAERTRTVLGRSAAPRLAPTAADEERVSRRDRVVEMMRLRETSGALPLDEVTDPAPYLARLEIRAARLAAKEIHEIVQVLRVARELRRALAALDPDAYPHLGAEWSRFPDHDRLIQAIDGKITAAGLLEDHASAELHRLRGQIRTLSERLTRTLQDIIERRHAEKVLRDDFITLRSNRFVLPVRTDAPFPMEGIVHGTSGTGQTLFIEPLETVAINNELVRLRDEEAREEERILAEWSAWLREVRAEVRVTADRVGEYDLLEAMARFSAQRRAVPAEVGGSDRILLREARHPVLETTLSERESPDGVVPLSLGMEESDRVLIISGPNTGGKTVALKTVGLLAVMAHAGLPVPAAEASFPAVSEVLVDIGDHQSIQASLSTFSSHVSNIASMIGRAGPGTLALLDEVGTGTDPAEGAALAVAVLDRLRQDGARVVATTHHGTVKVWGFTTEGVANAACEFDQASLRPTYRLLSGVAGSSSGLAIAERLGLPAEVVADARRRLDPREAEAEGYLERLSSLAASREESLRESEEERRRLGEERRRVTADAERRERARRESFADELERIVATFDEKSRRLLARVADVRERKAVERERRKQEARLRRAVRETMAEHGGLPGDEGPPDDWTPVPGDEVRVASLGRTGTVQGVRGHEVEVLLGRSTFRIPRGDLRPAGAKRKARGLPPGVAASLGDRPVPRELSVIGCRVDEALAKVDKFLDAACLAGHDSVRVVHGHGTGRLRSAVREMLGGHPHVDSFRPGGDDEGGDGVTVVRFRE